MTSWLRVLRAPVFGVGMLLAGCASQPGDGAVGPEGSDPIEPVNRAVFAFNDVLDEVLLKPVSYGYREFVPDPIRDIVHNFLRWLKSPVILANDLLQGDFEHAKVTTGRFLANAITLGTVEMAEGLGLPYREEDFGQTLGVHGVDQGAYVVLPLLGPSNVRDTAGLVVDFFLDPLSYITGPGARFAVGAGRRGGGGVDFRSRNYEPINDLKTNSVDFYAKIRTIYNQQRKAAVNNGNIPVDESMPDLSKEFESLLHDEESRLRDEDAGTAAGHLDVSAQAGSNQDLRVGEAIVERRPEIADALATDEQDDDAEGTYQPMPFILFSSGKLGENAVYQGGFAEGR